MDSSESLTSVSSESSSQLDGNNPPDQLPSSQGGETSRSVQMTKPNHQLEKGKEKVDGTTIVREGKAEEIGLLMELHELYKKTGQYALLGQDFYKFWIEEEREFRNKEELDNKINKLHARFLKNMDENVEGPTDHIDVEILRLSNWIWGNEIDSCEEEEEEKEEKEKETGNVTTDTKDYSTKENEDGSSAS